MPWCCAVLTSLLRWVHQPAASGGPQHDVTLPALRCLVQLTADIPLTVDWLLSAPDVQLLPLLPLVFHILPGVRLALAQLLFHLLFRAATLQAAGALGLPLTGDPYAVAEPFCHRYLFPYPAAIVSVALVPREAKDSAGTDVVVQRIWRAQQLVQGTAVCLTAGPAAKPEAESWEADFSASCAASLKAQDLEAQASRALEQMSAAQSHQACHVALAQLQLLCNSEQASP